MKGLELSEKYYEEFGLPMLQNEFPELLEYIAVGLVGRGSDRYGFDDEISADHDFEPGFCIFLPDEALIDGKTGFRLERAYAGLPREYCGYSRQRLSPVGGNRSGVMRTSAFYEAAVGAPDGKLSAYAWLHIPDYALAEAVNGKVFWDGFGEFSSIRESLRRMPRDVKLKRLAGNLLLMAQSGPYNYGRCCARGEFGAAQLACSEFVNAAMKVIFLLRDRYMPYYKWSFRALRELDGGAGYEAQLYSLLCGDCSDPGIRTEKAAQIEVLAEAVINELRQQKLTSEAGGDLERHAYAVNDAIADGEIRNLNILEAV